MGRVRTFSLFLFYLWGFVVLLLQAVAVSLLCVCGLQFAALAFGESYPLKDILAHLILSTYLLMLFPGQTVWTVRLRGPGGRHYTIVGDEDAGKEA